MLIFCLFHLYYVYAHRLQLSWWLYLATLGRLWREASRWGGKDLHAIHSTKKIGKENEAGTNPFRLFPSEAWTQRGEASSVQEARGGEWHQAFFLPQSILPFGRPPPSETSLPSVLQLDGRGARLQCWSCMPMPWGGKLSHLSLTARGIWISEEQPMQPWWEVEAIGSPRALVTKDDPGPFMCFTKVAKLRQDYNCSSPCQGWKVGSLKYAPAVLMKSLKSNKREKRARKATCITLIKEKSHREVVNLNHCLNFNLFINRICPSLRMLLLPFAAQQQLWA